MKVSLRQYRIVEGKWQFVRGARDPTGKLKQVLVVMKGETISSFASGGGQFYLDYRNDQGKRIRRPCGKTAREALNAWNTQVEVNKGNIDPQVPETEMTSVKTVEHAITHLLEVRATQSAALTSCEYSASGVTKSWGSESSTAAYRAPGVSVMI